MLAIYYRQKQYNEKKIPKTLPTHNQDVQKTHWIRIITR